MTAPSAEVLKNMIDNLEKTVTDKLDDHAKVHDNIISLIKELQSELRMSNGWKNKFMGALGVIMFVVFPIMSWALYSVVTIKDTIDERIANAIEDAFNVEPYVETNK